MSVSKSNGSGRKLSTFSRMKERFLQMLGRSERTVDDQFNDYAKKFAELRRNVGGYEKASRKFLVCLKDIEDKSHKFLDALWSIYDPSWSEIDPVLIKIDMIGKNNNRHVSNFKTNSLTQISQHMKRIESLTSKITQRENYRLDYDCRRRSVENLQAASAPDREKITRALIAADEAWRSYEAINEELIAELPNFSDVQAYFLSFIMKNSLEEECRFHEEQAKWFGQLKEHVDVLYRNSIGDDNLKEYIQREKSRSHSVFSRSMTSSSIPSAIRLAEGGLPGSPKEVPATDSSPASSGNVSNSDLGSGSTEKSSEESHRTIEEQDSSKPQGSPDLHSSEEKENKDAEDGQQQIPSDKETA